MQRAGIAVQVAGPGLEVLCASDSVAERVEWLQVSLGEGPGMEAVAAAGPVLVSDLAVMGGRWPMFVPEAVKSGIGAVYALPMQIGAIQVGVLDLYRDTASGFENQDFADAVAVADLLTALLLSAAPTSPSSQELGPWWEQSIGTREVHQATGMIVAQLGIAARQAYVRLRAYAYAHERPLAGVAHDVVQRRLRFDLDPDPHPDPVA